MKKVLSYLLIITFAFTACKTPQKILYFQDLDEFREQEIANKADITIQPKDMLSIVVSSRDPQLAALFNLPRVNYQAGSSTGYFNYNNQILGYTVDTDGNIDFPVIGLIHIAGLTRKETVSKIKERLIEENLIKDPVITIDFMNLHFSVIGEVKSPGRFSIQKDNITLLEAISMAGDLTIYGRRDGVVVIREDEDIRQTYKVDLRTSSLFESPVYYLQQNDIVYVQPNNVRAGQSTINENNVKSVSLWISIGSFLTSLAVLMFK